MQVAAQAVRPVRWEDVSRKSGAEVKEAAGLQLSFSLSNHTHSNDWKVGLRSCRAVNHSRVHIVTFL